MFQILIVDDEEHAADSLAVALDWEKFGIHKVMTAYSGPEAIETINRETVHLLITDIRMPGMTGLQLIEAIGQLSPKTKSIVLSGYNEFDYAKEAIRHGALDYLLKPVKDGELENVITTAIKGIRQEWETLVASQQSILTLKQNLPLLRSALLQDLIRGKWISTDILDERLRLYELSFQAGDSAALVLMRIEWEDQHEDLQSRELLEYAVTNIAEELCEGSFVLWTCKDPNDYLLMIIRQDLQDRDAVPSPGSADLLERKISELKLAVQTLLKLSVSIVMTPFGSLPADLPMFYQEALSTFRRQIGKERGLFIHFLDQNERDEAIHIHYLSEQPSLQQLMETGSWDKAEQKLEKIFGEFESSIFSSQEYVWELYFYLSHTFTHLAHKNTALLDDIVGHTFFELPHMRLDFSLKQLKEWSSGLMDAFKQYAQAEWQSNRRSIVDRIRRYIDDHLSESLSVETIAGELHFNSDYLSKVYKNETGESMSDYIYKLRMQRAASLLLETDDLVYDIGLRLGYPNPNYFIKVFKKFYEVTPQEFRERHR
ncbi:response regulator [Paenibacillus sp. HJL G12]|uniref:Response regulator n=1 Tax=Paenibacillus dendrobii TaxID=2691084 RepID=A0A7X3LJZ5_9BACL|nr:response regulator [Paenibacillus dendrobii]MWV46028.1 response regulator [Paenibacillus dendrobii]